MRFIAKYKTFLIYILILFYFRIKFMILDPMWVEWWSKNLNFHMIGKDVATQYVLGWDWMAPIRWLCLLPLIVVNFFSIMILLSLVSCWKMRDSRCVLIRNYLKFPVRTKTRQVSTDIWNIFLVNSVSVINHLEISYTVEIVYGTNF